MNAAGRSSSQLIQSLHALTTSKCRPFALALLLLGLTGCDQGIDRVPVSGVVLVDNKPLGHGIIRVYPEGARAAYGKIQADGRFVLGTYEDDDGTVQGVHPIEIDAREWVGPRRLKWHAPPQYASPVSGLTLSVDEATDDLEIHLTWNGGKPFIQNLAGAGQASGE